MPLNLGLEYIAEDGSRQRPIMIHRVCFGSIERFIGILTEHFAGKFPTWLADAGEGSAGFRQEHGLREGSLRGAGEKMIRCELDTRNEKIGYKIREARQVDRVPYMLIIGAKAKWRRTPSPSATAIPSFFETMTLDEFLGKLCADRGARVNEIENLKNAKNRRFWRFFLLYAGID